MFLTGSNSYTHNFAENAGGAVQWDDLEPFNLKETGYFFNNTAVLYGNDVATFPQRVVLITEEQFIYYTTLSLQN